MKTISKLISGVSLSVFASSVFVAVPVYARNGSDSTNQVSEVTTTETSGSQGVICKSFDSITTRTTGEVSKRGSSADGKWQQGITNLESKRAEWTAKIAAARAEAAKTRDANFAKLDAAATTDAQKAAVATYKAKVLAAISIRQASFDANFNTYFTGVEALLASQKTNSTGDVSAFKTAIAAAVDKAKASCTNGASGDTVKKQLQADLKSARESFKGQRTSDRGSIKTQLEALKKTRNDANAQARATFQTTLEAARTELKAAFPATSNETI